MPIIVGNGKYILGVKKAMKKSIWEIIIGIILLLTGVPSIEEFWTKTNEDKWK